MITNDRVKKILSLLLAISMILSYVPLPVHAAGNSSCEHHAEHTTDCQYAEEVAGNDCTHEHNDGCYAVIECLHTCNDECADNCRHNCTVENGCIVMELDCHHTHDDCGYVESFSGSDCTHNCAESECPLGEDGITYICAHLEHDEACGYEPANEGSPCSHVCCVNVDSTESCYKLLCTHAAEGQHDSICGYVEAVEFHDCLHKCVECTSEAELTDEPSTAESTAVCDCDTNDLSKHTTSCPIYSVPETPVCSCTEKCLEANVWCDVCGSDMTSCAGKDIEEVFITTDGLTEDENTIIDDSSEDVMYALDAYKQMPMLLSDTPDLIRYTVLILDTSGSMSGTPNVVQKEAAIKFCNAVLNAGGLNYVAIVNLNTSSSVGCTFSNDIETLTSYINGIPASGGTNINQALQKAEGLLDGIDDNAAPQIIKNIVLCSDGLPESGSTSTTGKYTSSDHSYSYSYANVADSTATAIKDKGYTVYSLGFFHSLSGTDLSFSRKFMSGVATEGHYYEVTNVEDLEFVFGEISKEITVTPYTFKFAGHLIKDDVEATCYYSDGYFLNDASVYSSHLATMSLCFEMTVWSRFSGVWTTDITDAEAGNTRWQNAYNLLTELGYTNFDVNDFWENKPTKDSIGVVAATKVNDYDNSTMIAVGVRGGGYEQEWASNFTVGKTGEHDGFAEAKNNVLAFLKRYISDNKITGDIKIWIVGYSRAGCVANMVSGELVDGYDLGDNVSVEQEDLFAYTFEAPQGALLSDTTTGNYSNIHNIINLNDIVPLVAPTSWGFGRYNTDRWLPSAATSSAFIPQKGAMLDYYRAFEGDDDYLIQEYGVQYDIVVNWSKILPGGDPFISIEYYDIPTATVLTESASFLFDGVIGNRDTYYYDFQAGVREIMALLNGGTLADLMKEGMTPEDFLTKFFSELTVERIVEIVSPMIAFNFDSFDTRKEKVKDNLSNFVKDVLSDSDLWGTIAFVADLGNTLTDTLWRTFESVLEDLFDKNTKSLQSLANLIIMVADGGLGQAHYPELTLAWLMSQDSYYLEGQTEFSYPNYRVVHINCPIDVQVYNTATGNLVAAIIDDVPQDVAGSSIYAYINTDGEKLVILPSDGEYSLSLTATDDGTMSYSVYEYSLSNQANTRIVCYFDVDITNGNVLTAYVPALNESERESAIPNGSSAAYTLTAADGSRIAPDSEKTGSGASNAVYSVAVSSNNDSGVVTGGGSYSLGSFAKVVASPLNGSTFLGWYEEDVLVSEDKVYRFAVTKNTNLVAKFGETKSYTLLFTSIGDGYVVNKEVCISAGTQIQLKAIANEECEFTRWSADSGIFENSYCAETWFTMPACNVTVCAQFTSMNDSRDGIKVEFPTDNTKPNLMPEDCVHVDGKMVEVNTAGEIWMKDFGGKLLAIYDFATNEDQHQYPTDMSVWNLKWIDENNDGTVDRCKAIRIPELDNFMTYKGTSIRINHSSDGIRFFTAVPVDALNRVMKGTLLAGELEGYKMVEMGTLYKWAETGAELTIANGAKSYVYDVNEGITYRQFSKEGDLSWFTGMLTELPSDAATLAKDILSRPYAVFQKGNNTIVLYGGSIQRSIYYVAQQNKDTWASGTAYDNYVEKIISTVEAAND